MWWYGWIPILTSRLLHSKPVGDLRKNSIATSDQNEYLLPPQIGHAELTSVSKEQLKREETYFQEDMRATIKSHLSLSPSDEIFYYRKSFDDTELTTYKRVAVVITNSSFVKEISLFGYPDPEVEALAEVEAIDHTGLVKYSLRYGEPHIHAKQVFGELRDVYHEHIYAHHGDFLLQPVRVPTGNRDEAIEKIFHQYQEKIVFYHTRIKRKIEKLEDGYGNKSPRSFQEISADIASARGEMIHALSFINLFGLSEQEEKSIRNSLESLTNLSTKFQDVLTVRSTVSNWKIFLLTAIASAYAGFEIGNMVLPGRGLTVSIIFTAIVVFGLNKISHMATRKSEVSEAE